MIGFEKPFAAVRCYSVAVDFESLLIGEIVKKNDHWSWRTEGIQESR